MLKQLCHKLKNVLITLGVNYLIPINFKKLWVFRHISITNSAIIVFNYLGSQCLYLSIQMAVLLLICQFLIYTDTFFIVSFCLLLLQIANLFFLDNPIFSILFITCLLCHYFTYSTCTKKKVQEFIVASQLDIIGYFIITLILFLLNFSLMDKTVVFWFFFNIIFFFILKYFNLKDESILMIIISVAALIYIYFVGVSFLKIFMLLGILTLHNILKLKEPQFVAGIKLDLATINDHLYYDLRFVYFLQQLYLINIFLLAILVFFNCCSADDYFKLFFINSFLSIVVFFFRVCIIVFFNTLVYKKLLSVCIECAKQFSPNAIAYSGIALALPYLPLPGNEAIKTWAAGINYTRVDDLLDYYDLQEKGEKVPEDAITKKKGYATLNRSFFSNLRKK